MEPKKEGRLLIFSAPSGAGKTTIVKKVMKMNPSLSFSISACSRPMREGESDGEDYYFLDTETFKRKVDLGEFLEWEEVYPGRYYGTLMAEVQRIWDMDKHVIFDVDVKGGLNIKVIFKDKALAIFVMPPSIEILEQRLRQRSLDSDTDIDTRMGKAKEEISHAEQFDRIIINDILDEAVNEAHGLVTVFLESGDQSQHS